MKTLIYLSIVAALVLGSGCGNDDASSNNGSFNNGISNNNGTGSSNNGSSSSSNNGTTNANNGSTGVTNSNNGSTGNNNSTGTSGTTGGTNNLVGIERLYTGYAKALCDVAFNCEGRGAQNIRSFFGARFETQAECEMEIGPLFFSPDLFAAEEAGRLTTDSAVIDECVSDLGKGFCDGPSNSNPPSCAQVFTGTVAENGLCAISESCAGENRCNKTSGNCEGVCGPRTSTCGGATCDSDQWCNFNAGACEPTVGNGGQCQPGSCIANSTCNYDRNMRTGVCVPNGTVNDGEYCVDFRVCGNKSVCEDDKCVAMKTPRLNEQCDPQIDDCEIGTLCTNISFVSELGTCLPIRQTGESCINDQECKWGSFCDGVDAPNQVRGTCVLGRIDGETCNNSDECASLNCVSNKCETRLACIP